MTEESITEVMPRTVEVGEEYRLWLEEVQLAKARFIARLKPHIKPDASYIPIRELGKVGLRTEDNKVIYTADTYLIGFYFQNGTMWEWVWSWDNPKLIDLGLPELKDLIQKSKELGEYNDGYVFEDPKFVDFIVAVAKHYGKFENTETRENDLGHMMIIGWKNIKINVDEKAISPTP